MVSSWQTHLDRVIDARAAELVAVRRHLHAHPEVSGEEYETSRYLCQQLQDQGFEPQLGPGGRGLIVDNSVGKAGKIALRADIDALAIQDIKEVAYRSHREGVMHACGHDVHSTILLGALLALKELQAADQLPWLTPVRGIFQPSEETATGAAEMVAVGALEGVQAIVGLHVDPTLTVGTVGLRSGVCTAHCDELEIVVTGRGGHAARPHDTADPIAAAAQLINSIYGTVPRAIDSQDSVVVSFGQIAGGMNSNVIPDQVRLQGTLRTLADEVRCRSKEKILQICRGIAESAGVCIKAEFQDGVDSVSNDELLTDLLRSAAIDFLGPAQVQAIPRPSMGSEDFSVYLKQVPGAMLRLGSTASGETGVPLHSASFDIDEQTIAMGIKIIARSAVIWSEPKSASGQAPKRVGVAQ